MTFVLVDGGPTLTYTTSEADPADPGAHLLTIAAAVTASWHAGSYNWFAQATRGLERETVSNGQLTINANPLTAGHVDLRSTAKKALDAIDAYLTDPANMTAASYTIAGRSLERWRRADLIAERSKWQAEYAREQAAAAAAQGLPDKRRIYVRWGA